MIQRNLASKLKELSGKYPVVTVTGPRQAGKTTLVKDVFQEWSYLSLEDPDVREFALKDPRGLISTYPKGAIFDEVQRAPELFSYIQTHVDKLGEESVYILTGSFNFGLMEGLSQSLAGRVAVLTLLPLSFSELMRGNILPETLEELMFTGGYPRIYNKNLAPGEWYANYITSYLERDVRQVKNITDLSAFQRFLSMCASRSGQIINLSSLGDDCGITHNTAKAWMSILEASYIIHLLRPHFSNFNKRIIKSPKIYFYDSGLLSYLLGVSSHEKLRVHSERGHIFETWVISEMLKGRFNRGLKENIYFWRDSAGHEIDCIIDNGDSLIPLEIKAGMTISQDFFKGIKYWSKISGIADESKYVVYAGSMDQARKEAKVINWKSFGNTVAQSL